MQNSISRLLQEAMYSPLRFPELNPAGNETTGQRRASQIRAR
jgi:hypothetical protein